MGSKKLDMSGMVQDVQVPADEEVRGVGEHCFVGFHRKVGESRVWQTLILRMPEEDVRIMWPKQGQRGVPSNKVALETALWLVEHQDEWLPEVVAANGEVRAGKREIFVAGA